MLALLALGDHAVVVAATEQAVRRHPLQERRLGAARPRPDPVRTPGRRARGAAAGPLGARRRAGPRPRAGAARPRAGRAGAGPGAPAVAAGRRVGRSLAAAPVASAPRPPPRPSGPAGTPSAAPRRPPGSTRCSSAPTAATRRTPCSSVSPASASRASSSGPQRWRPSAASPSLIGRCSQDDGAPPLWPWSQALQQLRADGGHARRRGRPAARRRGGGDPGEEFRAWEAVARAVLERPAPSRCCWCWRTCTGPTPRPCGCCATWWPPPRRGTGWRCC